jgi:hypothetical protein
LPVIGKKAHSVEALAGAPGPFKKIKIFRKSYPYAIDV